MALSSSVEKVLRLVEEKTGLPVHIEPDTTLPANLLAKVTVARGAIPFHQIGYQTIGNAAPDYLIVFQCGFLLRRYAVPPADRVDFVESEKAEATVRQWVRKNPKTPNLTEESITGLTGFLYRSLLNQLRSTPVGLRVDSWILSEFPDLAGLQQEALSRQLNDNAAAFRPDVQARMPEQALATNLAMTAAFGLYWSEKLNRPQIVLPYKATGQLEAGRALLNIWHDIPDDPAQDKDMIDAWARKLELSDWYRWVKDSTT